MSISLPSGHPSSPCVLTAAYCVERHERKNPKGDSAMGFDHVEKKFQPKEIKLECVRCVSTHHVLMLSVYSPVSKGYKDLPLCQICKYKSGGLLQASLYE